MPVAIQATDWPCGVKCKGDGDDENVAVVVVVVVVTFFFAWTIVCLGLAMATLLAPPPRIVVNSGGTKMADADTAITSTACFPRNVATVVDKPEVDEDHVASKATASEDMASSSSII
jgi:hypothetical protein